MKLLIIYLISNCLSFDFPSNAIAMVQQETETNTICILGISSYSIDFSTYRHNKTYFFLSKNDVLNTKITKKRIIITKILPAVRVLWPICLLQATIYLYEYKYMWVTSLFVIIVKIQVAFDFVTFFIRNSLAPYFISITALENVLFLFLCVSN